MRGSVFAAKCLRVMRNACGKPIELVLLTLVRMIADRLLVMGMCIWHYRYAARCLWSQVNGDSMFVG